MRSTKVSSPGELLDTSTIPAAGEDVPVTAAQSAGSLAALAALHGLRPSAQRPTLRIYLQELGRRWSFIMGFATARNVAMYTEAKLGQLWQVLAPLLNAGVYFLIFGLIIKGVSRGVPDYLAFLVTGVFVFSFTQRTFISTSKVITDSLPLIRALQFPRASLPLAYVMIELQQMLLSIAVLLALVLAQGKVPTWHWLLLAPALALLTIFNAGLALFAARTGARVNDFAQLLPFLMRTWLYMSGVIYSVQQFVLEHAQSYGWATTLLQANPAYIYITLFRDSLLSSQRASAFGAQPYDAAKCAAWAFQGVDKRPAGVSPGTWSAAQAQHLNLPADHPLSQYGSAYCHPTVISSHLWLFAAGWAVVAIIGGFFFFWRKEVTYGRG
ncbi:MAG TPA: ABC transporter permease [Streptosporangiaceae bacterium]|nr:ABC transporter permease [Streptosporangiaceae bacterium]